jgi:predicted aspartyl protease
VPVFIRSLALAAALWSLTAPAWAQTAPAKPAFEADAKSTDWMAIAMNRPVQIYLPVTIDGQTVEALLDSGAAVSVIDGRTAERLGMSATERMVISGAAGEAPAAVIGAATIRIGNQTLPASRLVVTDLRAVAARSGRPIAMVLGKDAFDDLIVDVDAPGRRIAFRQPEGFTPPEGAVELPLRRLGDLRTTRIMVEGGGPLELLVDLGLAFSLELGPEAARRSGVLDGRPASHFSQGVALGGSFSGDYTTAHSVALGGYEVPEVPIVVRDTPQAQRYHLDGVLGLELLSRFRMVFDYPHDRLFLIPAADSARPFRRDVLGMLVAVGPWGYRVSDVSGGGPADQAGLKVGDHIRMMDGTPIDRDRLNALADAEPGGVVRFELEDGGVRTVTLRPYY